MAFCADHEFFVDEEIPNRFRALRAFGEPVFDPFFLDVHLNRGGERVIGSQDFSLG